MQVRKWLKWGKKSVSDAEYPDPETTPPQALTRNPETPNSAAAFLEGLERDKIREWAKQLYMEAKSETLDEIVADRLLLALDAFEELQTRNESLDDRLLSQEQTALKALKDADDSITAAHRNRDEAQAELRSLETENTSLRKMADSLSYHMTEYRNALLQISSGVCSQSKMFTGACRAAYEDNPTSWCGPCLAREVLKQFKND